MERWTSRDESSYYHLRRIHGGKYEPTKKDLIQRVGRFEDIGLEPEAAEQIKLYAMGKAVAEIKEFDGVPIDRLRELAQAEQDGRLVVLPCKVGDAAYWVHSGIITDCRVYRIQHNQKGLFIFLRSKVSHGAFGASDVGRTIFFARKEAEVTLRDSKDGI